MEPVEAVIARSLWVAGLATLAATLWSIPLAYAAVTRPRLASILVPVSEALVGVPTVVVGLALYMLLSRQGPLGFLGLLYTPYAIALGEAILITPLLIATSYRVLYTSYHTYGELALSLGASPRQVMATVVSHAAPGLAASIVMGFSRAVGELGVAYTVGGNIAGRTRTMTTAIALDVSMGRYEEALLLGGVLALLTVAVSVAARMVLKWYGR